jgi:SAM-dependent methyltransferase
MNTFVHGLVRAAAEAFDLPGPVLEVGSYQVAGQSGTDLRPLFPGREYVGLDVRPGPGVDVVGDVEALPYPGGSFGTVLAVCAFEHVPHFWKGFAEVRRVLRPGGAFVVACPFYFHIHAFPSDYWRFTPAALELLLADYPSRVVGWRGPRTRPADVWSVAFRERHPGVAAGSYARYRELLGRYAALPLPWHRRLRYLLGRAVAGRRPFAPHLDRGRWECRWSAGGEGAGAAGAA